MAKDTPNKPVDAKASLATEHPEQTAPVAADKRKETKPKQPSQDEQGQEAPAGKAVQTGEKAAHTPEQASAPGVVNPVSEAGASTLSADEDFRAEWEIPLAELEERRKQEKKARRSSSKKAPTAKEAEADKPKLETEAAEKPDKPADKVVPLHPSDSDDKLRREQEALLHMLDEKGASLSRLKNFSPVKAKPSAQPMPSLPRILLNWPSGSGSWKRNCGRNTGFRNRIPPPSRGWPRRKKRWCASRMKSSTRSRAILSTWKRTRNSWPLSPVSGRTGVTQPIIVRPDGKDTYEIISGHRRDQGGIEAGIPYSPCIVRALNDEQAIQQMVEDNVNNRDISTMELARSLKVQLDSIKRQGVREALAERIWRWIPTKRSASGRMRSLPSATA